MKRKVIRRIPKPIVNITRNNNTTQKSLQKLKSIFVSLSEKTEMDPKSAEVQLLVEKCKNHISDNYYECDLNMFKELGNLYVSDSRFKENFDSYKPGFAEFLSKAILEYCMSDE